jgi:hypothetical protein
MGLPCATDRDGKRRSRESIKRAEIRGELSVAVSFERIIIVSMLKFS